MSKECFLFSTETALEEVRNLANLAHTYFKAGLIGAVVRRENGEKSTQEEIFLQGFDYLEQVQMLLNAHTTQAQAFRAGSTQKLVQIEQARLYGGAE